jgi:hypothetical protein
MIAPASTFAAAAVFLSAFGAGGGWFLDTAPGERLWTLKAPADAVRIEHAEEGVVDVWMECERGKGRIGFGALMLDLEASPAEIASGAARTSVVKLTSVGMASVSPASLTPNEMYETWTVSTSVSAGSPVLEGFRSTGRLRTEVEGAHADFTVRSRDRKMLAQFLDACAAS